MLHSFLFHYIQTTLATPTQQNAWTRTGENIAQINKPGREEVGSASCCFKAEREGQLPQEGAQPPRAKFTPAGWCRHSGDDSERGPRRGFFLPCFTQKETEAQTLGVPRVKPRSCGCGVCVAGTEPRMPWASLQLQTRIWFLTSLSNVNTEILRHLPEGSVMQRQCVSLFSCLFC